MSAYEDLSEIDLVYPLRMGVSRVRPFMLFRGILSRRACNRLITDHRAKLEAAGAGEYGQTAVAHQCLIYPDDEPRLFATMAEAISDANEHYRYVLTGIYEPFRLLGYNVGEHNAMHSDYGIQDRSKLSFSVMLNSNYTGGGLRILNARLPRLSVGDAVVFPSWTAHEALPCEAGVRYALVGWAAGPCFA